MSWKNHYRIDWSYIEADGPEDYEFYDVVRIRTGENVGGFDTRFEAEKHAKELYELIEEEIDKILLE